MKEKKTKEPVLYNKGPLVTYFILMFLLYFSITMPSVFGGMGYPLFNVGIILTWVFSMAGIILISKSRKVAPAPIIVLMLICMNLPAFVNSIIGSAYNYGFYLTTIINVFFLISFFLFIIGYAYGNYEKISISYVLLMIGLIIFFIMNVISLVIYYKYAKVFDGSIDQGMFIYMDVIPTTIVTLFAIFGLISPISAARKLSGK